MIFLLILIVVCVVNTDPMSHILYCRCVLYGSWDHSVLTTQTQIKINNYSYSYLVRSAGGR